MNQTRKLILYISMSLDGYIADSNDDLSFLNCVEQEGEDYGYSDFVKTIDTVLMGRKTYDKVLSMIGHYPTDAKEVYIITRNEKPAEGKIRYVSGNFVSLVSSLKQKSGKNIYCDGGAELATELFKHKLIDELILSIIPVFLGEGVRLFKSGRPKQEMELISSRDYPKGLVQLHYTLHSETVSGN